MKKFLVLIFILFTPLLLKSQPKIEVGGLLKIFNFFHSNTDFTNATDDGNNYMFIHGDIHTMVDFGDSISAFIMLGAWGQHGMNPYYCGGIGENVDPGARLLQAYFNINNLFDSPVSLRIGKECILYGDGALLCSGPEDGVEGIKLMFNNKYVDADIFFYRAAQFGGIGLLGTGTDIYQGNWNVYGLYPTIKLANNKLKISPYFAIRHVKAGKDSTNAPIWYGGRLQVNPIEGLNLVAEYTRMDGTNDLNKTDYAGTHIRLGADYNFDKPLLGIGGYYVAISGDDGSTNDKNETYESVLNTPYANTLYKDWPGFGPAHLMTTSFGISGLNQYNSTVVNLNVINGHVSYSVGALTLRGDFFMYKKDWVPDGVEDGFGNEIALLIKYNYKNNLTIGFTGGIWMPGDYQKSQVAISGSGAEAENAIGGYLWIAKSF